MSGLSGLIFQATHCCPKHHNSWKKDRKLRPCMASCKGREYCLFAIECHMLLCITCIHINVIGVPFQVWGSGSAAKVLNSIAQKLGAADTVQPGVNCGGVFATLDR